MQQVDTITSKEQFILPTRVPEQVWFRDPWRLVLDVKSIYTNIPIHDCIVECLAFIFNNEQDLNLFGLPHQVLEEMFHTVFYEGYFRFGEKNYHQKTGLAMGMRHSPPSANIYMYRHEIKIIDDWNTLHPEAVISLWDRCLDDIVDLWKYGLDLFYEFFAFANSRHELIQFTFGVSVVTGCLDFMDVTLSLDEDRFICSELYIKPTNSFLVSSQFIPPKCHKNCLSCAKTGVDSYTKCDSRLFVYELKCSVCVAAYIGQSCRYPHNRIYEHCQSLKKEECWRLCGLNFNTLSSHPLVWLSQSIIIILTQLCILHLCQLSSISLKHSTQYQLNINSISTQYQLKSQLSMSTQYQQLLSANCYQLLSTNCYQQSFINKLLSTSSSTKLSRFDDCKML